MRINKYVAASSNLSRRAADQAINIGRVKLNGKFVDPGTDVKGGDEVTLDSVAITPAVNSITIMLNKPAGYICSRDGQGGQTIYELLPSEYQQLNPIGRLDKESTGLLLMTNDGQLAQQLTHPSYQKTKIYEVLLYKPLQPLHRQMISDHGITLEDGVSKLQLERIKDDNDKQWRITMHEGRNRQIRRTFESLGYSVKKLHRTQFDHYELGALASGESKSVAVEPARSASQL